MWKPVLKKEDPYHYVSDGQMIDFIVKNSNIKWNPCCDFVREHGIVGDEGRAMWDRHVIEHPEEYDPEAAKWIGAFFEAHPWINKMMVVFDD